MYTEHCLEERGREREREREREGEFTIIPCR